MDDGRKERLEQARELRELVSMKMTKAETKELNAPMMATSAGKSERYPWGLSLNLESASLDKLNLKALPGVGDTFELEAKVKVTSVSQNETGDSASKSCTLQVTDMCLEPITRRTARRKA